MLLTVTLTPSSSANSRARQVAGSSPASSRPPGSSHSSRSFSSSTTPSGSSSTPLTETGKDIAPWIPSELHIELFDLVRLLHRGRTPFDHLRQRHDPLG